MSWRGLARALADIDSLVSLNPSETAFMRHWSSTTRTPDFTGVRWMPLHSISPYLIGAVIHAEDPLFFRHRGLWWGELKRQVWSAVRERRSVRGVSTITQQLARNLYLRPRRSIKRKLFEALLAAQLEHSLRKTRILELYLNLVEFGVGVWGVERAADDWLNTLPATLGPFGSVFLASLLPAPRVPPSGVNAARMVRSQRRTTALLYGSGIISATQERRTFQLIDAEEQAMTSGCDLQSVLRSLAAEEADSARAATSQLTVREILERECGVAQRAQYETYVRTAAIYLRGIARWPEWWHPPNSSR